MSLSFPLSTIQQHQIEGNPCKRVIINHHVRNLQINHFLKKTAKENEYDDEYTFRCNNLMTSAASDFFDYMFIDDGKIQKRLGMNPSKKGQNKNNFYVSHEKGEATIVFTSLTNKEIEKLVKEGNDWAKRNGLPIVFNEITGNVTNCIHAEEMANDFIVTEKEVHHVFITANMASRSFSVPKVVNGIMMVNEPGYAAAIQKSDRLATIDKTNENKIGNMYWFNFSGISAVCPLYNVIYSDYLDTNTKKDINGKRLTRMLDCINIFIQNDNDVNEKLQKWTETDLLNEIHKGEVNHNFVSSFLINNYPELKDAVDELLRDKTIDFQSFAMKYNFLGKTNQLAIKTKSSKPQNKKLSKDAEKKEHKTQINMWELTTTIVVKTLAHDKAHREFDVFYCDFVNIFKDNFEDSMKKKIKEIWQKIFVEKGLKNLEWKAKN